ncbi:hypothetical protein JKP88DRAFT_311897 [Tribonema minus]|uniref:JmjN domain-containing protein n=1 Tax=Tribonema minus TaxID=303371 RepID=A0A835Z1X8_9STRA|nr:hypothetical protein JKP88DRAFT_311897 [Tribonema minus]
MAPQVAASTVAAAKAAAAQALAAAAPQHNECPVFRPSMAEFCDFRRYLDSIDHIAGPVGLCKIIPPKGKSFPLLPRSNSAHTFNMERQHDMLPSKLCTRQQAEAAERSLMRR